MEEKLKKRYQNKLQRLNKPYLKILADILDVKINDNPIKAKIASKLLENRTREILEFFDLLKRIKKIRYNYVIELLANEFPNKVETVESLEDNLEILLFLYKENALDKFEKLVIKGGLRGEKTEKRYKVTTEIDLDMTNIKIYLNQQSNGLGS